MRRFQRVGLEDLVDDDGSGALLGALLSSQAWLRSLSPTGAVGARWMAPSIFGGAVVLLQCARGEDERVELGVVLVAVVLALLVLVDLHRVALDHVFALLDLLHLALLDGRTWPSCSPAAA